MNGKILAIVALVVMVALPVCGVAQNSGTMNNVAAKFTGESGWSGRMPVALGLNAIDPQNFTAPGPIKDLVETERLAEGEQVYDLGAPLDNTTLVSRARAISEQLGLPGEEQVYLSARNLGEIRYDEPGQTFSRRELMSLRENQF